MSNASVTAEILHATLPQCADPQKWADALNPALRKYGITSIARVSSFLAQTGYESSQYNRLAENLNYSTPKRLMQVWPRRFPTESSALPYVKNPERLANLVYADRLGNGNAASGDGFRYRGRGIIQVTGRSNYAAAGKELKLDLVGNPDLLLQPANAALSAAWFWSARGLNELADDNTGDNDLEDFTEITRRINGGTVGLQDRLALYHAVEARFA